MFIKKGFSLVELLIVLAVIGALTAVITGIASTVIQNARASEVAGNLKTLASGFVNTTYSCDTFPHSIDQLGRGVDGNAYGIAWRKLEHNRYEVITFTLVEADFAKTTKLLPAVSQGKVNDKIYAGYVGLHPFYTQGEVLYYGQLVEGELLSQEESFRAASKRNVLNNYAILQRVLALGNTDYGYQSSGGGDNPTSWSRRLERTLQQGTYSKYDSSKEGANVFGISNVYYPEKVGVFNWNNLDSVGAYSKYLPPAVLITDANKYSVEKLNQSRDKNVIGTTIIFGPLKDESTGAKYFRLYTVDLDGKPSSPTVLRP